MLYQTLGQYTNYLQARKLWFFSFEISSETPQLVSGKHNSDDEKLNTKSEFIEKRKLFDYVKIFKIK